MMRSVARAIATLSLLLGGGAAVHSAAAPAEPEAAGADKEIVLEARPVLPDLPLPVEPFFRRGGSDYKIGRQDLLELRVFDLEQLDQTVRVADDGSVTLPLLGRLSVAGLTKGELEALIARLLEERYVRNPQVTIFVKEYESKKVAVSGAVKRPGTYEMLGQKTLLEMLSMAGGLDGEMGKELVIFRQAGDAPTRRIPVELDRLIYGMDPKLNLVVEPGDIIYVPALEMVRIFVTGAVRNPNLYEVPRTEPVTVLKAITLAGGTTDRAAQRRVQVIRIDASGNRVTIPVDIRKVMRGKAVDPVLQKDDLVLVPEAFF